MVSRTMRTNKIDQCERRGCQRIGMPRGRLDIAAIAPRGRLCWHACRFPRLDVTKFVTYVPAALRRQAKPLRSFEQRGRMRFWMRGSVAGNDVCCCLLADLRLVLFCVLG